MWSAWIKDQQLQHIHTESGELEAKGVEEVEMASPEPGIASSYPWLQAGRPMQDPWLLAAVDFATHANCNQHTCSSVCREAPSEPANMLSRVFHRGGSQWLGVG